MQSAFDCINHGIRDAIPCFFSAAHYESHPKKCRKLVPPLTPFSQFLCKMQTVYIVVYAIALPHGIL